MALPAIDLECLGALKTIDNTDGTPEAFEACATKVSNYQQHYLTNYDVPVNKIFVSAIVSAEKLAEITGSSSWVRISIGKETTDANANDFIFIISSADAEVSEQEDGLGVRPVLETACCRNPPGSNNFSG